MRSKNCSSVSTEPNISAVHPANQRPKDRKMKILAIESSCDETAAAVVENGRSVLSSGRRHAGGGTPAIRRRRAGDRLAPPLRELSAGRSCVRRLEARRSSTCGRHRRHRRHLRAGAHRRAAGRRQLRQRALSGGQIKPLVPVHHLRTHIASNYITDPGPRAAFPVP